MSRKFYVTLILILFLLPLVSWYYLQSGLTWRKNAQDHMKGTESFPSGQWVDTDQRSLTSDSLSEYVTLVTRIDCDQSADLSNTLDQFYTQFKETKKTAYIILDECGIDSLAYTDLRKQTWYVFSCQDSTGLCARLLKNWPAGTTHALVDKKQLIRSYYSSATNDDKRILLEHMALLLPRERSEKVELKRGNQK